jgi:hypothetical protein
MTSASPPSRVDVAVALGVTGHVQVGEARVIEEAAFQKLHGRMVFPARGGDAAAEDKALLHTGLDLVAADPVGKRRGPGDGARREMRHRLEAFVAQAPGGPTMSSISVPSIWAM